jgi:hypothetical protein
MTRYPAEAWSWRIALLSLLTAFTFVGCSVVQHLFPGLTGSFAVPPHRANPPSLDLSAIQPPESILPLTISGDLTSLRTAVLQKIKPRIEGDAKIDGYKYPVKYYFNLFKGGEGGEGPDVVINAGRIGLMAMYKGEIETHDNPVTEPGCHLRFVYPIVGASVAPAIAEQGGQWAIGATDPKARIDLRGDSDTKCGGIPALSRDISGTLTRFMNSEAALGFVREAMAGAQISQAATEVWKQLSGPFQVGISDLNTNACLYPRLSEITVGKIEGTMKAATFRVAVAGRPTLVLQNICPAPQVSPIQLTKKPLSAGGLFKIYGAVSIPYSELSTLLQQRLVGPRPHCSPDDAACQPTNRVAFGELQLSIEHVYATDAGGRMLLAVTTSGYLNGTIYFWGTPTPAADGTAITFPDVRMDVETARVLDRLKIGLAELIAGDLNERLRNAARFDLSSRIVELKKRLSRNYTKGKLTLSVTIDTVKLPQAFSQPPAVSGYVLFEGRASAAFKL